MNIFERAYRKKLRFSTSIENLTVEDLYDLPLSSGKVSLDDIAKSLNKRIKEFEEESFVVESKVILIHYLDLR